MIAGHRLEQGILIRPRKLAWLPRDERGRRRSSEETVQLGVVWVRMRWLAIKSEPEGCLKARYLSTLHGVRGCARAGGTYILTDVDRRESRK